MVNNEHIVCFDVDDTLVVWSYPNEMAHQAIMFDGFGHPTKILPHYKHIELLKQFKARGHHVIVWSQGGYQWAKEVVVKLGLESYVDEIMTKPKWMVDDKMPSEWTSVSYVPIPGVIEPNIGKFRKDD